MEEWKDIEGYEGIYKISNLGRIISMPRQGSCSHNQFRKIYLGNCGYYVVLLYKDNKGKKYQLHRLIAKAFIPNPENKSEVNHINGIKTDNSIKNLEWVTHKENMIHARNHNSIAITQKVIEQGRINGKVSAKKREKSVAQYDKLGNLIKVYKSISQASIETGTRVSGISLCCHSKRNIAGGYKWKLIDKKELISKEC